MRVEDIARVCHEANAAYCISLGDSSQPHWVDAPEWQIDSAIAGVEAIVEGRVTSPEQSHESWLEHKRADGWIYGPDKNPELKQHPCMVPYAELPAEQRAKDALFNAIVFVLKPLLDR